MNIRPKCVLLGLLISLGPTSASAQSTIVSADAARLEAHVRTLAAMDRHWTASGLESAAQYIESHLKAVGLQTRSQRYMARGRSFRNVIANLGPNDAPLVVVGAHYDTYGHLPGADDNASGVAGVLEIARLLKAQETRLKMRIELVAWPLEEPPFFALSLWEVISTLERSRPSRSLYTR